MTNHQHPITPPPELVKQWCREAEDEHSPTVAYSLVSQLATKAARWGANQELEACCEWTDVNGWDDACDELRATRRPKPQSLKEQALDAWGRFTANEHTNADQMIRDFALIRRALEQLDD